MIPFPPEPGSPYVILTAAAAVVSASVAAVALYNRRSPGAGWLAITMFLGTLVASFAVLGHRIPPEGQVAAGLAAGALGLLAVVPFVAFVVTYTGRGRHLTYPALLGYGGPVVVAAALYGTSPYHDFVLLAPIDVRTVAGITLLEHSGVGLLLIPIGLYVVLLLVGALLLVVQTVVRHDKLYLGQSAALIVSATAPLGAVLMVGMAAPLAAPFPTVGRLQVVGAGAALLCVAGVTVGYAAVGQRLFEFVPAVRQIGGRAAIDDLAEGLLVVDENGNVVDLNASAETILGCGGGRVVGSATRELFETVGIEDLSTTPITFERGNRTYEVTSSAITDGRERRIGRTFVLRDVTRRELRKQRLQVLNRILRHNVRNDMSVVKMNAGLIAEQADPRLAELGESMNDVADDLVDIGEKVRRIEKLLARESLSITPVEIETLAESAVDEVRSLAKTDTVEISVDADAGVVEIDHALLELALENVVENAIEHNDSVDPRVAVTADGLAGGVRLTVADDGPGIPENELVALDSGRETDLQHASSLGLWLVHWSVERLGGDLRIERLHPRGSAVSIWVPDHGHDTDVGGTPDQEQAETPDAEADRRLDERREDILDEEGVDETAVATVADGVLEDGAEIDTDETESEETASEREASTQRSERATRSTTARRNTTATPPPPPASARISTAETRDNKGEGRKTADEKDVDEKDMDEKDMDEKDVDEKGEEEESDAKTEIRRPHEDAGDQSCEDAGGPVSEPPPSVGVSSSSGDSDEEDST